MRFIIEYLANNRVVPPHWSRVSADERTLNMAILEYYEAVKTRYTGSVGPVAVGAGNWVAGRLADRIRQ